MNRFLRIANGVMLVLFVSWAGFQHNDPDAIIWIIIYGLAALGCLLHLLDRFLVPASWAYVVSCVAGAIFLLVRIITENEFIFDERGREMMGLLICSAWIGFLALNVRTSRARTV